MLFSWIEDFEIADFLLRYAFTHLVNNRKLQLKQARKSSEDAQAAGYARFEIVWARKALGQKSLCPQYSY